MTGTTGPSGQGSDREPANIRHVSVSLFCQTSHLFLLFVYFLNEHTTHMFASNVVFWWEAEETISHTISHYSSFIDYQTVFETSFVEKSKQTKRNIVFCVCKVQRIPTLNFGLPAASPLTTVRLLQNR